MKVRLKPPAYADAYSNPVFQFHEGPIKTLLHELIKFSFFRFQFHEGPIKTIDGKEQNGFDHVSIP